MSITDELREWNTDHLLPEHAVPLTAIADRIDEAHMHAIGYVADYDPETMAENGWVKLPKDADGVPIHIGDELQSTHYEDGIVAGMACFEDTDWHIAVRPSNWDTATWRNPKCFRHVQPDSWERIIRDAIAEGFERTDVSAPCDVGNDELVERCRRLAGE